MPRENESDGLRDLTGEVIPELPAGELIREEWLRTLVAQLNRNSGALGFIRAPRQIVPDKLEEELFEAGSGVAPVRCTIQSEQADHLITVIAGTSTVVYVAKPYNLRGDVATRTVNGEAQEILPAYGFGNSIFVIVVDDTGLSSTPSGREVNLDMNVDGRTWAESA